MTALATVQPTEREYYIATQVVHALWRAWAAERAEYAWARRCDLHLFPPTGMDIDAAARELTVQLEAYGLINQRQTPETETDEAATPRP